MKTELGVNLGRIHNNNDNNNNSYIALYPVKIYKLAALYIINIKIRLTIKKSTSTINAYINIKLTHTKSQVATQLKKRKEKKSEEANSYFDIKAFHTLIPHHILAAQQEPYRKV